MFILSFYVKIGIRLVVMNTLTKLLILITLLYFPFSSTAHAGKCSVCHQEIVADREISGEFDTEAHSDCIFGLYFGGGVPPIVPRRVSTHPPELAAKAGAELAQEVAAELAADFPAAFAGGGGGGSAQAPARKPKKERRVSWHESSFLPSAHDFKVTQESERVARAKALLIHTKVEPISFYAAEIQKRVSRRFDALGPRHRFKTSWGSSLILSGPASSTTNQQNAVGFCKHLGKGARLPTANEYESFANALFQGPEAGYAFHLIPDLVSPEHQYWTAPASFVSPTAYVFDWTDEGDRDSEDEDDEVEAYPLEVSDEHDDYAVRCVIEE